jgi:hypothetical protein
MGPAVLLPHRQVMLRRADCQKEHRMSSKSNATVATMGIDIGKNSFMEDGVAGFDVDQRQFLARVSCP